MSLDVLARDGYKTLPIGRPERNILVVDGRINGQKASFLLDTGVSIPGLTIRGLPPTGKLVGNAVTVSGLKIPLAAGLLDSVTSGKIEIKSMPVYIGPVQAFYAQGLMGATFLRAFSAIADLHNLRLYLRPPGTGRPVKIGPALIGIGLAEVPFKIIDNVCYVEVELNDTPGLMMIDTGAASGAIDTRFAVKAKIHGFQTDLRGVDAAGGESDIQLSRIRSFKIGGVNPLRATYAHLAEIPDYASSSGKIIGLLGMDILGPNGTIIDFAQRKMYFFKAQ